VGDEEELGVDDDDDDGEGSFFAFLIAVTPAPSPALLLVPCTVAAENEPVRLRLLLERLESKPDWSQSTNTDHTDT